VKDLTEILEAFSILETAKEESPLAGRLLEALKTALRRHSTSGSAAEETTTTQSTSQDPKASGLACSSTAPTSMVYPADGNIDDFMMDPTLPSLDDLWQVFGDNVDSGTVDWNSLFAESDTAFLSMQ
jgi:hypothetical protein